MEQWPQILLLPYFWCKNFDFIQNRFLNRRNSSLFQDVLTFFFWNSVNFYFFLSKKWFLALDMNLTMRTYIDYSKKYCYVIFFSVMWFFLCPGENFSDSSLKVFRTRTEFFSKNSEKFPAELSSKLEKQSRVPFLTVLNPWKIWIN